MKDENAWLRFGLPVKMLLNEAVCLYVLPRHVCLLADNMLLHLLISTRARVSAVKAFNLQNHLTSCTARSGVSQLSSLSATIPWACE